MTQLPEREGAGSYLSCDRIDEPTRIQLWSFLGISIAAAILLMLSPNLADGEKGGYWFFARTIAESFRFSIPSRAPLYSTYLIPFVKLGPALGLYLEYFIGSALGVFSLLLITRRSEPWLIAFAMAGFILVARTSHPPVQWYGMACVNFGFFFFNRARLVPAFLLFFVAYMLRGVYILFPVLFIGYGFRLFAPRIVIRSALLAAVVPVLLLFLFESRQSGHPLNNAYTAEMTYFPGGDAGLTSAAFVQSMNLRYNEDRNLLSSDFYFTQREIFGNATTIAGMVRANPRAIARIWLENVREFLLDVIGLVPGKALKLALVLIVPYLILVLYQPGLGVSRAGGVGPGLVYAAAAIPAILIVIFFLPAPRYLVPIIPVIWICLDSIGMSPTLFTSSSGRLEFRSARTARLAAMIFVAACSVVLIQRNRTTVTLRRPIELAQEVSWLERNIADHRCDSVLFGQDAQMYGAFLRYPQSRIKTICALPPYPAKVTVSCAVVSDGLMASPGNTSTNDKLRYDLHIKPAFDIASAPRFHDLHFLATK